MSGLRLSAGLLALLSPALAGAAQQPAGLHEALDALARSGRFSGAVVVRDASRVHFARGYGPADPFTGRAFTPDTPVDSASLAKPVTAATVLMLVNEGKIELDQPIQSYLPEYPYPGSTVRHLLNHSAALDENSISTLTGKTNADLLAEYGKAGTKPLFAPGTAFIYCNLCTIVLAMLVERVSGRAYLDLVQAKAALPPAVTLRPARLADWKGRAIGYARSPEGKLKQADSYEDEKFYGPANLSISAAQLAHWGAQWWTQALAPIARQATTPAVIDGKTSGLTWGNWYCEPTRRCHYLGHHEGFHHMLYWDGERRISVAMVSNNTLEASIQQRLQRALVAFAEGRRKDAAHELASPMPDLPVAAGTYRMPWGQTTIATDGHRTTATRRGLAYPAYLIGRGIRYIPGLDVYISRDAQGRLHWLGLHEDAIGTPIS